MTWFRSYAWSWVAAPDQAALVSAASVTSTPSVTLIPSMTFGNWFLPLRRRDNFEAAWIRRKTISLAVFCDRAPFVRTLRCGTVAKRLSIAFYVHRWSRCSAGNSWKAKSAVAFLVGQATAFSCLVPYFASNRRSAACASARVPDPNHAEDCLGTGTTSSKALNDESCQLR